MATFLEIREFRFELSDPSGAVDIVQVADSSFLPAVPLKDTVYNLISSGAYVKTDKVSGAIAADYYAVDLLLSDARIGDWIDAWGIDKSKIYGINAIIRKLGDQLRLKSTGTGPEALVYTSLTEMYNYYVKMRDELNVVVADAVGISTGTYLQTKTPEIAGGNL